MKKTCCGYTLVEILVVVTITGLLAAIVIPNFILARRASQRNACVANLKQIDAAIMSWRQEQKKSSAYIPTEGDLFGPRGYILNRPTCPSGGSYKFGLGGTDPTCSHDDERFPHSLASTRQ